MINQLAQQRTGISISPLVVIGAIFLALVVVEGILAARFWIELAASGASDGLRGFIVDVSQPLVAPFAGTDSDTREIGSFEQHTLIAAIAYMGVAIGLVFVTLLVAGLLTGNEVLSRQKRRQALQHFDHTLIENGHSRLLGTVALSLTPAEASRALKMLKLERLGSQLYVIPASGGCIIAAFSRDDGAQRLPFVSRISSRRESYAVRRALQMVEQRFQLPATPAPQVEGNG